jgi:hypothetical protein
MSLGSATDVCRRVTQTSFGVPEAEIEKHVFQPGGIHFLYEKFASIRKQLQRKIRGWPGICFFFLQSKERM